MSNRNVVIVGGGLCGLAAAIYLARAGRVVTVFEKRRTVGGRAVTHRRKGFRFNLGPHALYRGGASARVLRELGIPAEGGRPPNRGIALRGGREYTLPGSPLSLLTTSILSPRAKLEAAALLWKLRRPGTGALDGVTFRQWLDDAVHDETLRDLMASFVRLATYVNSPDTLSAGAALAQFQLASRKGVTYIHEGWQKLVDGLHGAAVAAGVNFVSSSRIVAVVHDLGVVRGIELGGLEEPLYDDTVSVSLEEALEKSRGTRIPAETVLLAVDPATASSLLEGEDGRADAPRWRDSVPVTLACLDVALDTLPQPKRTFALGVDTPYYYSVHSQWAQIAPKGGALIHVAKYLSDSRGALLDAEDEDEETPPPVHQHSSVEQELEQLLDRMQPGWRERVVHKRFLPNMVVSNSFPRAATGGLHGRPPVEVPGIRNLYVAGDWVGDEGMLSDAALASARTAAMKILAG
jgi:phytoene dehydrogenase-like protein